MKRNNVLTSPGGLVRQSSAGDVALALRVRAMLSLLAVILPLVGLAAYLAVSQRNNAAELALQRVEAEAAAAARYFDGALSATELALNVLAQTAEVRAREEPVCSQKLAEALVRLPGVLNVGLIDVSGAVVCSALATQGPVDLSERAYFKRARETGSFSVGDYQVGRITGRPSINVGLPVVDATGRFDGVLFAAIDLQSLDDLRREVLGVAGATTELVGADGIVIYRDPDVGGLVGRPLPEETAGRLLTLQSGITRFVSRGLDGAARVSAAAMLPSIPPEASPRLMVSVPRAEVLRDANRDFIIFSGVTAFIVVFALLFRMVVSERRNVQPRVMILDAVARLERGERNVRTGLAGRGGPEGELGRAVDWLLERAGQGSGGDPSQSPLQ